MDPLGIALQEITLVLFTTLAPSGAIALGIMCLPMLIGPNREEAHRSIDKFLALPLFISMIGLVASATHLGNPANALYVFMGVGRSPLSTEVFFAVVFLLASGLYWLYSFAEHPRRGLQSVWLVVIILSSLAFVMSVAFAYNAETIISWNTPYVPANLWLNSLVGGPILALFGLKASRFPSINGLFGRVLLIVAAVALVFNILSASAEYTNLSFVENAMARASDLVPFYGIVIMIYGIVGVVALVLDAFVLHADSEPAGLFRFRTSLILSAVASFLVFAGIFAMRFMFYMMHLTL